MGIECLDLEDDPERLPAKALPPRALHPALQDIVPFVAGVHSLTPSELLGRSRVKHVARARRHLWAMLRERGYSLPEIGHLTDRDHTTVLTGIRLYERETGTPVDVGSRLARRRSEAPEWLEPTRAT